MFSMYASVLFKSNLIYLQSIMRLHLVLSAKHRRGRSTPLISERKVHEIINRNYMAWKERKDVSRSE